MAVAFGGDRVKLAQLGKRQRGALRDEAAVFLLQRAEAIEVDREAFAFGERC